MHTEKFPRPSQADRVRLAQFLVALGNEMLANSAVDVTVSAGDVAVDDSVPWDDFLSTTSLPPAKGSEVRLTVSFDKLLSPLQVPRNTAARTELGRLIDGVTSDFQPAPGEKWWHTAWQCWLLVDSVSHGVAFCRFVEDTVFVSKKGARHKWGANTSVSVTMRSLSRRSAVPENPDSVLSATEERNPVGSARWHTQWKCWVRLVSSPPKNPRKIAVRLLSPGWVKRASGSHMCINPGSYAEVLPGHLAVSDGSGVRYEELSVRR
ncbi:MAG: hypothetical protein WC054_00185 [Candidatus Nanopelagicales bacterium]